MGLSFIGLVGCSILFFILSSLKKIKNKIKAENKYFASTMAEKKFKEKETESLNQTIDLANSLNVTQYGNDVLKNIGELSNFMFQLTQNTLLERTSTILEDILDNRTKRFSMEESLKHEFLANYTKDRLMKQVTLIEKNIQRYEYVFKDFDRVIKNAEEVVKQFNITNTDDIFEIEKNNTKKSNLNLLKNKIVNLKKSKLYHHQAIVQLKVILALNNNLVVEFDNIIHQMIPLVKNSASIDSIKSFDLSNLSNYVKQIKKVNYSTS